MVNKYTQRVVSKAWNHQCAVCGRNDYLEFYHLIPASEGGSDECDNIILLCSFCHAAVHGRTLTSEPRRRTSIDYESAKPILELYFSNQIGTKETKQRLNLSQKTHLTESSLYKRYKRENNIDKFYNNVDLVNSKRSGHVQTI